MILWLDAQLSPALASWITASFPVTAIPLRELGLRDASDPQIFVAARLAGAVVMTKDSDFVALVERRGAPPQVLWLTCGNTSSANLKKILLSTLDRALDLLVAGEPLVEINDSR